MIITRWNLSGAILLVIVTNFFGTEVTVQERIALRPAKVGVFTVTSYSQNADSAASAIWTGREPYDIQHWDLASRSSGHDYRSRCEDYTTANASCAITRGTTVRR